MPDGRMLSPPRMLCVQPGTREFARLSWKTIGARLRRDPQVCKLRWGILKQTDQHVHVHPPHEPEAED